MSTNLNSINVIHFLLLHSPQLTVGNTISKLNANVSYQMEKKEEERRFRAIY